MHTEFIYKKVILRDFVESSKLQIHVVVCKEDEVLKQSGIFVLNGQRLGVPIPIEGGRSFTMDQMVTSMLSYIDIPYHHLEIDLMSTSFVLLGTTMEELEEKFNGIFMEWFIDCKVTPIHRGIKDGKIWHDSLKVMMDGQTISGTVEMYRTLRLADKVEAFVEIKDKNGTISRFSFVPDIFRDVTSEIIDKMMVRSIAMFVEYSGGIPQYTSQNDLHGKILSFKILYNQNRIYN